MLTDFAGLGLLAPTRRRLRHPPLRQPSKHARPPGHRASAAAVGHTTAHHPASPGARRPCRRRHYGRRLAKTQVTAFAILRLTFNACLKKRALCRSSARCSSCGVDPPSLYPIAQTRCDLSCRLLLNRPKVERTTTTPPHHYIDFASPHTTTYHCISGVFWVTFCHLLLIYSSHHRADTSTYLA